MSLLLELSNELLHQVVTFLDPEDTSSLLRTCNALRDFVRGNRLLHKELYLTRYDDPEPRRQLGGKLDWEGEVQRNVKLEKILQSEDTEVKRQHLGFASERIRMLTDTARVPPDKSKNIALLNEYFNETTGVDNLNVFLCSSSLFDQGGTADQSAAPTQELRQESARLHCLWGRPIDPVPWTPTYSRIGNFRIPRDFLLRNDDSSPARNTRLQHSPDDVPVHMVARGKVYDLSEYTLPSLWGPFMDDGSHHTDWEKMEAIMCVLGFNLARFTVRSEGRFPYIWAKPWVGATPHSFPSLAPSPSSPSASNAEDEAASSSSEPSDRDSLIQDLLHGRDDEHAKLMRRPDPALEAQDPYGVTGTYMRVVCFLDYNDLYNYNFHSELGAKEDVGDGELRRRAIDTEEAIRLIRVKLRVTRVEPPPEHEEEDWDEKPDPDFSGWKEPQKRPPIVHFAGDSRSLHASWDPNANSKIRGTVRQTPSGDIRWTTFSIFHGEERWRSEGIQVGGLRAGRGIIGSWFDKDYDLHGPAGPTAFWKEGGYDEEAAEREARGGVTAGFEG